MSRLAMIFRATGATAAAAAIIRAIFLPLQPGNYSVDYDYDSCGRIFSGCSVVGSEFILL